MILFSCMYCLGSLQYFLEILNVWFQDTGRYYLATRGVLELEQYILDMYPGSAVKCEMCKKVCVQVRNSLPWMSTYSKYLSRVMRKPTICICENKDADQLRGNCEADQRLCFRYLDSTIPLVAKSKISSFWPSSVGVQPGLCQDLVRIHIVCFLVLRLICCNYPKVQRKKLSNWEIDPKVHMEW